MMAVAGRFDMFVDAWADKRDPIITERLVVVSGSALQGGDLAR